MSEANKHVMDCVDLDDGGSRRCLGCRQFVHGNLTETPPGECPTPYKSPKQLLDEALAREAALREELAELREELSEEFDDEERKTETLQEAIAWIKKDRADYKSQWLSASESLKLQGITIRVGADREAALRVQLNDATTSLETISKHQGEPVGFLHKPDPHGKRYDCERANLCMGDLTDDELANGVFLHGNEPLDIDKVMSKAPGYHPSIAWLTAAKDRIRWLSRALEQALADKGAQ